MEETVDKKLELINTIRKNIDELSDEEKQEKNDLVENRLFEFANFLESKTSLLYMPKEYEINTDNIIKRTIELSKIVVLPTFNENNQVVSILKVTDFDQLKEGPNGLLEPDASKCKVIDYEEIDIAIIPGIVFDEKGGRLGFNDEYYEQIIPKIPATSRKVALTTETQVVPQVPLESRNRHIDIVITEKRIIYKI